MRCAKGWKNSFDRLVDVGHLSDRDIAILARTLELDIAIDLKGFTQDSRTGILLLELLPSRSAISAIPVRLGANYIDYLIADRVVIRRTSKNIIGKKSPICRVRIRRTTQRESSPTIASRGLSVVCLKKALSSVVSTITTRLPRLSLTLDEAAEGCRRQRVMAIGKQRFPAKSLRAEAQSPRHRFSPSCVCTSGWSHRIIWRGTNSPIYSSIRCPATPTQRQAMRCGQGCRL